MSFVAIPGRTLSPDEVQRYHDDGVIMIKQAIDPNWLRLIETGVEKAREDMSLQGRFQSRKTAGYQTDTFLWKRIDAIISNSHRTCRRRALALRSAPLNIQQTQGQP